MGGDRLPHAQDAGSIAAYLFETKTLLNSTTSDTRKGDRFVCLDVNDHFLATPMSSPEHVRVQIKCMPTDIMIKHNIDNLDTSRGREYVKIQKGASGLKQAAILACQHLNILFLPYGYSPILSTIGLWCHDKLNT